MNKKQIEILVNIALASGDIALKYFKDQALKVTSKPDNSPVSKADREINDFIEYSLKKHFPEISIISEEGINRCVRGNKFWLIDPIDGTSQFIAKGKEFTVNIALIEDGKPVFGIIYAPKQKDKPLYFIDEKKCLVKYLTKEKRYLTISQNKLKTSLSSKDSLKLFLQSKKYHKIITSKRSEKNKIINYLDKITKIDLSRLEIKTMPSSLKFCEIIEGKQDILINQNPTMEWDSAAGHALILAYGGCVLDLSQNNLKYNKKDFLNDGFIAFPQI